MGGEQHDARRGHRRAVQRLALVSPGAQIQPDGRGDSFVAGSIGSAFAANVEVLLLSRVLLGVAVGIASYTAPLYLSEMASENVRGKMISMYQLMVTLGIVLAFLSDTYFSYSGNWRAMLGVLALPAVVLIVL